MKKLMILSLAMALLASPAWGYKQEDLDKLAATNACEECDLRGADLREPTFVKPTLLVQPYVMLK